MSGSGAAPTSLSVQRRNTALTPPKPKLVGDGIVHGHRPGPVHERFNPAAGRIGRIQIKRRRRYLIPERQDREDGAEPAGGAEQIPVADFVDAGIASEHGYGLIWFR